MLKLGVCDENARVVENEFGLKNINYVRGRSLGHGRCQQPRNPEGSPWGPAVTAGAQAVGAAPWGLAGSAVRRA